MSAAPPLTDEQKAVQAALGSDARPRIKKGLFWWFGALVAIVMLSWALWSDYAPKSAPKERVQPEIVKPREDGPSRTAEVLAAEALKKSEAELKSRGDARYERGSKPVAPIDTGSFRPALDLTDDQRRALINNHDHIAQAREATEKQRRQDDRYATPMRVFSNGGRDTVDGKGLAGARDVAAALQGLSGAQPSAAQALVTPLNPTRSNASTSGLPALQDSLRSPLPNPTEVALRTARERASQTEQFERSVNQRDRAATRVEPAPTLPFLAQGVFIDVAAAQEVSTDLPGTIEARVVSPVYDSAGRGMVLVPQGARLRGHYDTAIAFGQEGIFATFTSIVYPNGARIALEGSNATDGRGRAGMPGDINHHYLRTFVAAAAMGAIGLAVDKALLTEQRKANSAIPAGSVTVAGGSTTPGSIGAQVVGDTARNILSRELHRGPTGSVKEGQRFRVQLARDLTIDPALIR